ncbi:MAG: hypothetical protein JWQ43_1719 [Glaciihabitans sp.]|nr:hypothetical protein [Glaciihabitans sp.]
MASYLLCSTPAVGHVTPLIAIGAYLVEHGHRVLMLTGSRFEQAITAAGMEFQPLTGIADFDDRDTDSYLPDRDRYTGLARAQYDIQTMFVKTIPAQNTVVTALLADNQFDAVLVDNLFAGIAPQLLDRTTPRPPILAAGVTPLAQLSVDAAPSGMGLPPATNALHRVRNRGLNLLARKVLFRDTQRTAERMFEELGAAPLTNFVMDVSRLFDRFLQLSPAAFEYPRRDLSPNVAFVGPAPMRTGEIALPEWWSDLDESRPVVHVTQGTIDNHNLDRLLRPTLDALADVDVTVVVTMGGRNVSELGPVPANARVASFLPYNELLPLTDVFVTNGGFGGVQQALRHGIPLVIAGDTEDKPEVAARVAWSGVGVNLKTGSPTAQAVRGAVETILGGSAHRTAAKRMADSISTFNTCELIAEELAAMARR